MELLLCPHMHECCSFGPLEKEVLEIVWKKECVSVRCVMHELNYHRPKQDKLAYTTIMTILKRLVDKNILKRTKKGRSYEYKTIRSKDEFVSLQVKHKVEELIEQFGESAKTALAQETKKVISS